MKYLKVWTDLRHHLTPFGEAEKGRLFDAMMEYAECGTAPDLRGNERFIWETVKAEIDRQREAYKHKCDVNRTNGASRTQSHPVATNGGESQQERKTEERKTEEEEKKQENKTVLLTQYSSAAADYRTVVEAYNEICSPALPQVKQLSDDRKKHIKTGCSRLAKAGLSWRDYFSLVADSDFLMGRDGRWQNCGFDWLIGPKNMLKVLEGNYANRLPAERAQTEEKDAAIREWEERHQ